MTNVQEFNALRGAMINAILAACEKRKSGRIVFMEPIECYYESSDSGFMGDGLAMINTDKEAIMVCEGEDIPSRNYDFDDDDDGIVSANMYLEDLVITSLADLCNRLKVCKKYAREARQFAERIDRRIAKADNLSIKSTNCNFECENSCHWVNMDAIYVNKGKIGVDGWGDVDADYVTLYSKCEIVDAMNAELLRRKKAKVFDGTNEYECEAYDNMY